LLVLRWLKNWLSTRGYRADVPRKYDLKHLRCVDDREIIAEWGERRALIIEYVGLTVVFVAYAFIEVAWIAVALYVIDHLFFAMRIVIKNYFQKIADPKDIESSMGVSFTINHIASVVIPAIFGYIWIILPAAVFLAGAGLALVSALLALLIPSIPTRENVAVIGRYRTTPEPAE
jgi:hypothetical protein